MSNDWQNRQQSFIDLYNDYVHGTDSRRDFLRKLTRLAGSAAVAATILPWLEGTDAQAAIIAEDDRRLDTRMHKYPGKTAEMSAYVARPAGVSGPLPAVVVIHENRGLTDHIRDVARRVALEGFVALAPDMLSPVGGTPNDQDAARDRLGEIPGDDIIANLVATSRHAATMNGSTGNVGCVGFCWGGQRANLLAVHDPDLKAAVAYYGSQPKSGIENINAALLLHYAENDDRVNAGIDAYRDALQAAGKEFQIHIYPGTQHAFNNDTRPARYNEAAARLAWQRTIDHLKRHLS